MKAYEDYFAQDRPGLTLDRAMPPAPDRTKDAQLFMSRADWVSIDSAELAGDDAGVVPIPSYFVGPNSFLRGIERGMLSIKTRGEDKGEYFIEAEKSALLGVIGRLALPSYDRPFLHVDPRPTMPGLLVCYKNEATSPKVAAPGSLLYDDLRYKGRHKGRVCLVGPRGTRQEFETYRFSSRITSIDHVGERPAWVHGLLDSL